MGHIAISLVKGKNLLKKPTRAEIVHFKENSSMALNIVRAKRAAHIAVGATQMSRERSLSVSSQTKMVK